MENEAIRVISKAIEAFSNHFYKNVADRSEGNVVCSALSAHVVLSMATFGAEKFTEKQMKSHLHLNEDEFFTWLGFQYFLDGLNALEDVVLKVGCKIYVSHHFPLTKNFKQLTRSSFRSESETINFDQTLKASNLINEWCANATSNKIDEIITSDDLDLSTLMVLLSATYFKGDWCDKFNSNLTKPKTFHLNKTLNIEVPTMFIKNEFYVDRCEYLKITYIGIPYKNQDILMLIVTPDEIDGLDNIEKNLDKVFFDYRRRFVLGHKTEVQLYLPKFKVETNIDLKNVLQEMGMADMFSDNAKFGKISDAQLKMNKILHKTSIEISEEGGETTAVSTVNGDDDSSPQEIHIDRPFFYKIIDKKRNVTILSGRVINPVQQNTLGYKY